MSKRPHTGGRVSTLQVTLSCADRAILERWVRSSVCPYGLHKRARAVLLVADGLQMSEVARRVDMGRHHVYMWLRRFQQAGADGLLDQPRHDQARGRWARRKEDRCRDMS